MSDPVARLNAALEGRYAIERELGEGGMATVYLAEDLKHERKVALKVLKPELAAVVGAERFLAEIKTTANLQHPHILPLFDSGEADSFLFYVMPYVDGETLRGHLDREKQLGVEDAVEIAKAVAGALDYAHRQGVVHRDIKPENILLQDGQPMVSDFGIALAVSAAGGSRLTETGLSLGTPHYMSPEQATADRAITGRSDTYSLACVTYEMLAGEPPHTGGTAQAVVMRIITDTPRPVKELRPSTPLHVDRAVQKALAKIPADRFEHATEFAAALAGSLVVTGGEVDESGQARTSGAPSRRPLPALGALASLVVLLSVATVWAWRRSTSIGGDPHAGMRLSITIPDDHHLLARDEAVPLAVSPDGQYLVYVGRTDSLQQLYLRPIDRFDPVPIPGTVGASLPFFSPDGDEIGFLASGALQKVRVDGGRVEKIADVGSIDQASWGAHDSIVFSGFGEQTRGGLWQVASVGGVPELISEPDEERGGSWHADPQVLPDGSSVLFSLGIGNQVRPALLSLSGRTWKTLSEEGGWGLHYVSPGYILLTRFDELIALPFDPVDGQVTGSAVTVASRVYTNPRGYALFDVSRSGSLVFVPGVSDSRFVWVDREGNATAVDAGSSDYRRPRLSPDGLQIAVEEHVGDEAHIWVLDLQGRRTPITAEGWNRFSVWSPSGDRIAFSSLRDGTAGVYWKRADGDGPAHVLGDVQDEAIPWSWFGDSIAYEVAVGGAGDIWIASVDGDGSARVLIDQDALEEAPAYSPDGEWLAYTSNESGDSEVYARRVRGGDRELISAGGGRAPVWSRDGSELFYRFEDSFFSVPMNDDGIAGPPEFLFSG